MTQTMKFAQGASSVEFSEAYSDKTVRVSYVCPNGYQGHFVDFNEKKLLELRKWINTQLRKMNQAPKTNTNKK